MTEPVQAAIDNEVSAKVEQLAKRRGVSSQQILRERLGLAAPADPATPAASAPSAPPKSTRERMTERMDEMFDMWMMRGMMAGGGFGMGGMGGDMGGPRPQSPPDPTDAMLEKWVNQQMRLNLVQGLTGKDSEISQALKADSEAKLKEIAEELKNNRGEFARFREDAEKREHEREVNELKKEQEEQEQRHQEELRRLQERADERMDALEEQLRNQPKPPSDLDVLDRAATTFANVEERRAALRRALTGMAGFAKEQEQSGNKSEAEKVKEWIELISEGAATVTDIAGRAQGMRRVPGQAPAVPAQGTPPGPNYPPQPPTTAASPDQQLPPALVGEPMYIHTKTGKVYSHSQWMATFGVPPELVDPLQTPPPSPPPSPPPEVPKAPPPAPPTVESTPPPSAPEPAPPPATASPPAEAPKSESTPAETTP